MQLDPKALTAAYAAHQAHAADPGRKGSGVEKAIITYLSALPSPEPTEAEVEAKWRDLALQFDGHRMEALSLLRYVSESQNYLEAMSRVSEIKAFLAKPPLSGEAVLAQRIAAWNSRSRPAEAKAGMVKEADRDVLFFASYCGDDNPDCTDRRPCSDCLAMSNVYRIPGNTKLMYQRELGAAPALEPVAEAKAEPVAVPDGWVLVPREPTEAMRAADAGTSTTDRLVWNAALYRAMLAASPTPPALTDRAGIIEEGDDVLLFSSYRGLLVLRTMCGKAGLSSGEEAADRIIKAINEAHPSFPARSALKAGE